MLDKLFNKIELRLSLFIYDILFKMLSDSFRKEIIEYLLEYKVYSDAIESWYDRKCKDNDWSRFDNDSMIAADEAIIVSSGAYGIYISLANPDDYCQEFNEYNNLIYCCKSDDLLYIMYHYDREVRHIKESIDKYFEELNDVDKN